MAKGYTSRMLRAGVGRQLHAEPPLPTKADFSASIYDQRWASLTAHNSVTKFAVLALDEAHAQALGERKLVSLYGPGVVAEMRLLSSEPRRWVDAEALVDLLAVESHADHEERQLRFAAMEAAHG